MASSQNVRPAALNAISPGTGAQRRSTKPDLERAALLIALRRLSARAETEALPTAATLLRRMAERVGQAPASTTGHNHAAASFCAGAVHREQD
jgi:hypothetical protein